MKQKTRITVVALMLALLMALVACSAPAKTETAGEKAPEPTAEAAKPAEEPAKPAAEPEKTDEWPEMTIIVAHPAVTTDVRHAGWEFAAEYLSNLTGGKIVMEIYPAGQLGTTRETTEATATGAIQISQNPPANIEPFAPTLGIMNIPYLLPSNYEDGKAVMKGPAGEALLESISNNSSGLTGIAIWDALYNCYTSNVDFRKTEDLSGQKIRIMSSAISEQAIKSWGGTAIVMDLSEVYTALQTGAVDGQESGIGAGTYSNKYYEVQKYLYQFNSVRGAFITIANEAWWNGLDAKVQEAIKESLAAGEAHYDELRLAREKEALDTMSKYLEIINLTPEQETKLKETAQPGCQEVYLQKTGDAGKALVDIFAKETAKYN
jgi:tripartite ATP-independent transporter DctP family solute receptor